MSNRIRKISELGQSIWLDFISRDLLRSGELRALINEGVTGMTSNPSIFQKSIAKGTEYDEQIRELARDGKNTGEIYEALAFRDIQEAADQLRSIYNETQGRDGFVSIEVDPKLAHDSLRTIEEGRRLFKQIERPNVMIKVPATEEGLSAICTLIGDGINVNVTLIFSIAMYEKVMNAYIDGLRLLKQSERQIRVGSVASFFVSRVDTLVDNMLTDKIESGETGLESLRGQAAVANAKIAYDRFTHTFESDAFADLEAAGARVQRPLWASTSTKNPAYTDTKYIDTLIGAHTVNTVPPVTLDAIRDHGTAAQTIDMDVAGAYGLIERLGSAGVSMERATDQLLREGVQAFADSFEKLIADLDAKRARYV